MEQIFSKLKFITHGEGFSDITYDLNLCVEKNIKIIHRTVQMALVGTKKNHRPKWYNKIWPNFFGTHAVYHVTR